MKIHEELVELRQKEKRITAEILNKLQVMEDSRAYLKIGYSSLFDYLVRGLQYSEATAYQRQACVRLSREIPNIKEKLNSGVLTASAVTSAFKYIRKKPIEEKRAVIKQIEKKSARQVKQMLAGPMPTIKTKKLEYSDKVYLRLELTHKQNQKLERLLALKSHQHNFESLLEDLLDRELERFENTNFKPSKSKNPRQISQTLRNHLLKKSGYKCQFSGCNSTQFLQIDHVKPVSQGGDNSPENLQVLCAAHNLMKG